MEAPSDVRIDKWLWAVRLFKSRSLASEACQGGHVKIAGQGVKPARSVRAGETIIALAGGVKRTVKVLGLSAILASLATAVTEFAWYALATGVDPWRIAKANLLITFGLRPAVLVLLVGLVPCIYVIVCDYMKVVEKQPAGAR